MAWWLNKFEQTVRGMALQASSRLASFATAPAVPGAGGIRNTIELPRDAQQAALLKSREALFGRATYYAGPVPSYVQTYPGSGLTPAGIQSIQNEVLVAGYMLRKADLDEQVHRRDTHIQSTHRSVCGAITSKPFFTRPRRATERSRYVADYVRAVVEQITGFATSQFELVGAHATGYKLQEIWWHPPKRITFGKGFEVVAEVPRQLDTVNNKHTRFDVATGRPLLDMGRGGFVEIPDHKFVYHVTVGDGFARMRGYMYPCIWWHHIKQNSVARWAIVLGFWGIPVPWGKVDSALWQDEERKAQYEKALRDAGEGQPFLTTDDWQIEQAFKTEVGDARGMHAALIDLANAEMSKAIQLQILTTDVGSNGSYKMAAAHQDTKETGDRMLARNLEETDEERLFRVILERAIWEYDDAGNKAGILSTGLCPALGATPEEILHELPRAFYRIDREMGPAARMGVYKDAVAMRLKIDMLQMADEMGLNLVDNDEDAIPGELETLSKDGAAVSTVTGKTVQDNPSPDAPSPSGNGGGGSN